MKINLEQRDDIGLITITGEVSESDSDLIRSCVLEHIEAGGHDVVLDMVAVEGLDSRALESLLVINEMIAERLGRLVLGDISETVERILHATRLNRTLEHHPTVDAAIKAIREAA
ncbi:STAS domain-containing protein [Mucisphaera calidilacus]|uniref:Anti-sigma factor antagonist n=1 Tax=Mucisphaera calidilacus TaxID=2527982 RepID=A0A518BTC6_9BACT|nr:STAS domain-containing protein [Mucisphaera calidilacus]QDU70205.1 STAS domain protein [Mucisphaera calidilacus]